MIHASSPRSASNIGCTLLRSQHFSGIAFEQARTHHLGLPLDRVLADQVDHVEPEPLGQLLLERERLRELVAGLQEQDRDVGRICVAMCITIVPSAWNAEAIAIRSRPERSSAHVRISRGCASSNRSFSDEEFVRLEDAGA